MTGLIEDREFRRPASKGDMRALDRKVEALQAELVAYIADDGETTRRHFDVVAENIHRDVAGANADDISLIRDQQLPGHERRIRKLERMPDRLTISPGDNA
jgi:hypothetical protein